MIPPTEPDDRPSDYDRTVTDQDSHKIEFKTMHGTFRVHIHQGRLRIECDDTLVIVPSADNSVYVHGTRLDRIRRLYEPG
jgi:hypothetical protein